MYFKYFYYIISKPKQDIIIFKVFLPCTNFCLILYVYLFVCIFYENSKIITIILQSNIYEEYIYSSCFTRFN